VQPLSARVVPSIWCLIIDVLFLYELSQLCNILMCVFDYDELYPDNFPHPPTLRKSAAQRIDNNLKSAGPQNRSRAPPTLGATLVAQITGSRAWFYSGTPDIFICRLCQVVGFRC
jgi:hypothetical protein